MHRLHTIWHKTYHDQETVSLTQGKDTGAIFDENLLRLALTPCGAIKTEKTMPDDNRYGIAEAASSLPALTVAAHARDAQFNPVYLGAFPSLAEALAAGVGYGHVEIEVTDPSSPGGNYVLPDIPMLFITAPAGWDAELQMGTGLISLNLGGEANFRVVGNDIDNGVFGSTGDDRIDGAGGNDFLEGFFGNDTVLGGTGNDTLLCMDGNDSASGAGGNDELLGDAGDDTLAGGTGSDSLFGGDGRDRLKGGTGADELDGGAGRDVLEGGAGKDVLTGGAGADRFVFAVGDSAVGARRDVITDFAAGVDLLDLRQLGADLDFRGDARFTGAGDEVRYVNGIIAVDLDGDRDADLQIALGGAPAITADDFL